MIDNQQIERTKAFKPIYTFLISNGITEYMKKVDIISKICYKYKPDFAKKVLDLWFSVDSDNRLGVYYKQDVAFSVDCEELNERVEANDDIFLSDHDTPLVYKEKIDKQEVASNFFSGLVRVIKKLTTIGIFLAKYVLPLLFVGFLLKECNSHFDKKNEDSKKTIKKDDTKNKKKTITNEKRVHKENKQKTTSHEKRVRASMVKSKTEKTSTKQKTHEAVEKKVETCNYFYTTSKVNLRSNSNKNSTILGKIKKSEKVCVMRSYGSWKYIKNKGWIYAKFLIKDSEYKKNKTKKAKTKKAKVKKRKDTSVWHCVARSQRASGWVERIGKQNSMRGALKQCEMRRQTSSVCKIVNCYKR